MLGWFKRRKISTTTIDICQLCLDPIQDLSQNKFKSFLWQTSICASHLFYSLQVRAYVVNGVNTTWNEILEIFPPQQWRRSVEILLLYKIRVRLFLSGVLLDIGLTRFNSVFKNTHLQEFQGNKNQWLSSIDVQGYWVLRGKMSGYERIRDFPMPD